MPFGQLWLLGVLLLGLVTQCLSYKITPWDYKIFRDRGSKYFRSYLKQDQHLYVGAADYVYRMDWANIRHPQRSSMLYVDVEDMRECAKLTDRNRAFYCRNHIRSIHVLDDESVYVCGTGADLPMGHFLEFSSLTVKKKEDATGANRLKCPADPDADSTYLYLGSSVDSQSFHATERGIFRTPNPLRTKVRSAEWLYDPSFVASLELGGFVYFFFRETALEKDNCQKEETVSRVARICKNDLGGGEDSNYNVDFTSFVKATLNCTSSQFPYHFTYLKDMKRVGDSMYGLFAAFEDDGNYSAVCKFELNELDEPFNTDSFVHRDNSQSIWKLIRRYLDPQIGMCVNDSRTLSDAHHQFHDYHTLFAAPLTGHVIYVNTRMRYDRIEVFPHQQNIFYFLCTGDGDLEKFYFNPRTNQHKRVAEWNTHNGGNKVFWMTSDPTGQWLYMGQDDQVAQYSVSQCASYHGCHYCSQDPHCAWHTTQHKCVPFEANRNELLQNVFGENPFRTCGLFCRVDFDVTELSVSMCESVFLQCRTSCTLPPGLKRVWQVYGETPLHRYVTVTQFHNQAGILVESIQQNLTFRCSIDRVVMVEHRIVVSGEGYCDVDNSMGGGIQVQVSRRPSSTFEDDDQNARSRFGIDGHADFNVANCASCRYGVNFACEVLKTIVLLYVMYIFE